MKSPKSSASRALEYGCRASGRFTNICVVDSKTGNVVRRVPDQSNLILDVGMDAVALTPWFTQLTYGVAGSGTTDTREAVTGAYFQSGTTVTRGSGPRDFTAADVGKLIKFASGEESRISAFTSATVVTVVESRTVASTSITLYDVGQVRLTTETKRSNTYPVFNFDDGTAAQTTILDPANAKITLRRTYDFTAEVGAVSYTEIGVSPANSISAPNGTFAQSGTAVTRSTGTGTFSSADVGRVIKWASGQEAVITVYDSSTSVTVDRSQSVTAATISVETALFSRIKLASAINLVADQQLRFTYNLTLQIAGVPGVTESTVEGDSVGWPVEYAISNITTNGAKMVVTTTAAHHYVVGGQVNLADMVMPRTAIIAISSTGSNFTVTAAGHGKSPGDSVVIQGTTPSQYNGTWTIDSVSGNNFTVLSALNPGPGTMFGTVRLANPTPWFNGEWTIAAVPTSTSFEVTTAITPPTPQLPEGIVRSNVKRKFVAVNYGVHPVDPQTTLIQRLASGYDSSNSNYAAGIHDGRSTDLLILQVYTASETTDSILPQPSVFPSIFPSHWQETNAVHQSGTQTGRSNCDLRFSSSTTTFASAHRKFVAPSTYSRGSFLQDTVFVFNAADFDYGHLLFFALGMRHGPSNNACPQGYFLFEERQRKSSLHKLTVTVRRRWARDLSVEP